MFCSEHYRHQDFVLTIYKTEINSRSAIFLIHGVLETLKILSFKVLLMALRANPTEISTSSDKCWFLSSVKKRDLFLIDKLHADPFSKVSD